MKQIVGYLLIICCVPVLLYFGNELWNEVATVKKYEQKIEQSIVLPEVQAQLPVTLIDSAGEVFSEEYVEWAQPLPINKIPKLVKELFLLSEDEDFYSHIGFDVSAIGRAVVANSSEQSIQQGGSTITQQLVRMRYLSEEKTYERKLMELFYAYELEKKYEKETILEMYLNEIYFSNQVYGIAGAASYYFNKELTSLTLAQTAFIAAIPNNPSLYDPLNNFDNTKKRQERLIDKLAEHEVISLAEAETHKAEAITLSIKNKIQKYPTYSTYVLQEMKWLVAAQDGFDEQLANAQTEEEKKQLQSTLQDKINQLLQTGIIVYTALDAQKQEQDEEQINSLLTVNDLQASATVINNTTREIVSLYGGKNYEKFDLHRAFQTPRQPGSSFKPLAVYAPFFETTTNTANSTVSGGHYCVGNFCPQNYGGGVYGNVSISTAFKYSYNTSALRLYDTVGNDTAFSYLDRFTFRSLVEGDRTYAAALGGLTYGVTTLEMTDAYSSFIDGMYTPAHSIRKITDLAGNTLYSWPTEREEMWSPSTVKTMRSLLNDVVRSGTGAGLYSSSSYIGAKTGTTNDYKDFWLAGLTDDYTAAVWVGYDKPRSMQSLERARIHFSIFNAIMN
ncbi:transglycosylase domain-containing protein [Solibacillus sp. FSL H8-0538]|uniref:transglycosylase domain-containing protein n=1 Tax=Solibacillus sp. FSL H8-0538 TaxID=2921400 RepID=UPI0030F84815